MVGSANRHPASWLAQVIGLTVGSLAIVAAIPVQADAYNGSGAAGYADTWALSRNSHYLSFNDDCTNFVSQAMRGGGFPFVGYETNETSDTVWWQDAAKGNWSHSWTVANDLRNFLIYHNPGGLAEGTAPGTSTNAWTPSQVLSGDVLFYNWGTGLGISHSSIQTGAGTDPNSKFYGNWIDQHVTDRKHAFWSLYPYNAYRSSTTIYFEHILASN